MNRKPNAEIFKELIKKLESLGTHGVMASDLRGGLEEDLRDAEYKLKTLKYYLNHACRKCDKLMDYHGENFYQCPKCKYAEIVKTVISDEGCGIRAE